MDHKVKVIKHLRVGHHNWIEDSTVKDVIGAAKRDVQQALKPGQVPGGSNEDNRGMDVGNKLGFLFFLMFLGVAYAFPDAKGFGGNTTTAALARKVFGSTNMRNRLVQLVPQLYRPAITRILLNDLTLLRLMSCSYKLLPSKIGR